jgi:hypothetical protein
VAERKIAELKIGAFGEPSVTQSEAERKSQMAEREFCDFVEILQDVSPQAIKGKRYLQCRCEIMI